MGPNLAAQELVTISVRRKVSSNKDEIISGLQVRPKSTILDLKILVSNRCKIPPSEQLMQLEGEEINIMELDDGQTIEHCGLKGSSVLWLASPSIALTD